MASHAQDLLALFPELETRLETNNIWNAGITYGKPDMSYCPWLWILSTAYIWIHYYYHSQ